jgi:hypothetical protein
MTSQDPNLFTHFFKNILCFWQQSVFRGPAWTWNEDRQQYYLHQFDPKQPDLNYKNPEVVAEMKVIFSLFIPAVFLKLYWEALEKAFNTQLFFSNCTRKLWKRQSIHSCFSQIVLGSSGKGSQYTAVFLNCTRKL